MTQKRGDETQQLIVDDTNNNSIILHTEILDETRSIMSYSVLINLLQVYAFSSTMNIWVLYAKQFYSNTTVISIVLSIGYIAIALESIIYLSISDKYGYDTMIAILYSIIPFGILIESCSISFPMLCVGYFIGHSPAYLILFAYVAWILPLYYSKQYTVYLYQVNIISKLISPILGGIISYYASYRISFIFTTIIATIAALFALCKIFQTQNKLQEKQLTMKIFYQKNIVSSKTSNYNKDDSSSGDSSRDNYNDNIDAMNIDETQRWQIDENYRFPVVLSLTNTDTNTNTKMTIINNNVSLYQWCILIIILIQNSLSQSCETAWITWYTVYMKEYYKINILISTSQLSILCLGFVIGTQSIKYLSKYMYLYCKYQDSYITKINIIICVISNIITMFISTIWYPIIVVNNYNTLFFFYPFIYGLFLGNLIICQEMILLQFQPKEISGAINGIRGFIRSLMQGLIIFLIGLYWDITPNFLWYIQSSFLLLTLVFMIIFVILLYIV